jgi:hypothetical protein
MASGHPLKYTLEDKILEGSLQIKAEKGFSSQRLDPVLDYIPTGAVDIDKGIQHIPLPRTIRNLLNSRACIFIPNLTPHGKLGSLSKT